MKVLRIQIFTLILCVFSCCGTKNTKNTTTAENENSMNNISIMYSTFTRGYHDLINVENKNVEYEILVGNNQGSTPREISAKEWNQIESALGKFKIDELSNYEAPSTNSYSDKGKAATLKIEKDGILYSSVQFDASNPPEKLKPLIKELTALVE